MIADYFCLLITADFCNGKILWLAVANNRQVENVFAKLKKEKVRKLKANKIMIERFFKSAERFF